MASASTRRSMLTDDPRNAPETGSDVLRDPPAVASDEMIRYVTGGFYDALRRAVAKWGGVEALAAQLETAMSGVSDRLWRKEVKGALQRSFLDYAAIVCTTPLAAESFLFDLCDLLGYERPKKKRTKTVDEKLDALVRELRRAGELGQAAIDRAARELGADPREYLP